MSGVEEATSAPARAKRLGNASLGATAVLLALLAGFAGALFLAPQVLAVRLGSALSVYMLVLVGLTVALWLLTWAYVRRVRAIESRESEGPPA